MSLGSDPLGSLILGGGGEPEISESVSQTLTLTQSVDYTLSSTIIHTRNVSQTLSFTQDARRVKEISASQTLAFAQETDADAFKYTAQLLEYTQSVDTEMVRYRPALQTLAFTQSAVLADRVYNKALVQNLTYTETASIGRHYDRNTLNVLSFTQTVAYTKIHIATENVNQSLAFTQTVEFVKQKKGDISDYLLMVDSVILKRVYVRGVTQTLNMMDSAVRGPIVYSRGVEQTLTFREGPYDLPLPLVVAGQPVVVQHTPAVIRAVRREVILRSRRGVVRLPVPEFDDTDARKAEVFVKRTMGGQIHTYVRSSRARKLSYTFILTRAESLRLRRFVLENHSEVMTLINWKGERFYGQITNNPFPITTTQRGEITEVQIDFEGLPL